MNRPYFIIKRINAVILAIILFVILIPFNLLILLINVIATKGHPFYKQNRYGYLRKEFAIFKFRSININKDKPNLWGRFIRFTSIDELPQLINILKGDMNFIGPRPLSILEKEIDELRKNNIPSIYSVVPGLTGYAQIHFSNKTSIEEKTQYDSYYVKNVSFFLDLKISLITLIKFLPVTIHKK